MEVSHRAHRKLDRCSDTGFKYERTLRRTCAQGLNAEAGRTGRRDHNRNRSRPRLEVGVQRGKHHGQRIRTGSKHGSVCGLIGEGAGRCRRCVQLHSGKRRAERNGLRSVPHDWRCRSLVDLLNQRCTLGSSSSPARKAAQQQDRYAAHHQTLPAKNPSHNPFS